eukprot:TRINITY_DN5948_c0_g1_i1.p2 TRINITY_DN5948_c0_g1~~TRINITY_DN5948_c0_g1_i1.p2  ORF type:complete len:117 (+),score=15.19 TRINITY_DN5948_c0_g1_i1:232-582(+)
MGCLFHILACIVDGNYWSLFIFLAYFSVPVPLIMLSNSQANYFMIGPHQSLLSPSGMFLTSSLSTSIFAIPSLLLHLEISSEDGFGYNVGGIVSISSAILCFFYLDRTDENMDFMM